jgi:hypothetical protein
LLSHSHAGAAADDTFQNEPHPHETTFRKQADTLRAIHGYISEVYSSELRLSGALDAMVEELEDAEVQAMM